MFVFSHGGQRGGPERPAHVHRQRPGDVRHPAELPAHESAAGALLGGLLHAAAAQAGRTLLRHPQQRLHPRPGPFQHPQEVQLLHQHQNGSPRNCCQRNQSAYT